MENCGRRSKSRGRTLLVLAGVAAACAPGCAGEGTGPPGGDGAGTTAATVRASVHAGVAAPLHVLAEPDAICRLQVGEAPDQDDDLTLYADARGVVAFETTVKAGASVVRQVVDCSGPAGARVLYPVELRVVDDGEPTASDTAYLRDLPPVGTLVPALAPAAALALDDAELFRRGYPARPDAKTAPALRAQWIEAVTAPSILVSDRTVELPGHAAGTPSAEDNASWCGFVVDQYASLPFRQIWGGAQGTWKVPTVSQLNYVAKQTYYSSTWVGLGGFTSQPLAQLGTEQDASCSGSFPCSASYYAWIEYFPASQQVLTGMTVHAGDLVIANVTLVGANGVANHVGPNAQLRITNFSVSPAVTVTKILSPPAGSTFVGESAEWIMERPKIFGNLTHLVRFLDTTMTTAWGMVYDKNNPTANGTMVAYGDAAVSTYQLTMTNLVGSTIDTLATVASGKKDTSGQELTFHWVNNF